MRMNEKKILHLITTIELGGAEKQLFILARHQIEQGFEVEVFYLKGKPDLKERFEKVGVKVNPILANKNFISQVMQFRKFIRKNSAPVHAHLPQAELVAAFSCKKNRFIVSRHNFEQFWPNKPRLISTFLSRYTTFRAASGIAISEAIKMYLVLSKEISKNFSVTVIHYGYNQNDKPSVNLVNIDNKVLNSNEDFKLGTIGRLVVGKNYETMLNALANVIRAYPTVKFFIVGSGTEKNKLTKLCIDLKIQNNVIWLGKTEFVSEFLSKIDLFIFASKAEGFGLVLLEAMSEKKPILAADNSAISEVLGKSYCGLFPTNDYNLLSDKILEIISDPSKSNSFVSNYEGQLDLFNPIEMARKVQMAYIKSGFQYDSLKKR
jgi:glycosyltransferase involved in cell wall biosynthesis